MRKDAQSGEGQLRAQSTERKALVSLRDDQIAAKPHLSSELCALRSELPEGPCAGAQRP
jgi:hypothetical protein